MKVKADRDESSVCSILVRNIALGVDLSSFIALRCHVGLAGRCRQVQGSRYHRPSHQAPSYRWYWYQAARTRCPVGSPRSRSIRYEDRTNRGRHPHSFRLYQEEGWSTRSKVVDASLAIHTSGLSGGSHGQHCRQARARLFSILFSSGVCNVS
jgi:hypothetical protein